MEKTITTPIGDCEITEHRDGVGETGRFECGCVVVRRGRHFRRTYCDHHAPHANPTPDREEG